MGPYANPERIPSDLELVRGQDPVLSDLLRMNTESEPTSKRRLLSNRDSEFADFAKSSLEYIQNEIASLVKEVSDYKEKEQKRRNLMEEGEDVEIKYDGEQKA